MYLEGMGIVDWTSVEEFVDRLFDVMLPFIDEPCCWNIEGNGFYERSNVLSAYHSSWLRVSGEMEIHRRVSVLECSFRSTAHSPRESEGRIPLPEANRWRESS